KWNGPDTNCADDPSATADPFVPQFSGSCYTPGPTNVEDIANYKLSNWSPASVGESAQRNVQVSASYGRRYRAGRRFGTGDVGAKIRDAHKYNDSYTTTYTVAKGVTIPVAQFAGRFTDPNYYDTSYPWPSQNVDYTQVQNYVQTHPQQFTVTGGPGPNKSNY